MKTLFRNDIEIQQESVYSYQHLFLLNLNADIYCLARKRTLCYLCTQSSFTGSKTLFPNCPESSLVVDVLDCVYEEETAKAIPGPAHDLSSIRVVNSNPRGGYKFNLT